MTCPPCGNRVADPNRCACGRWDGCRPCARPQYTWPCGITHRVTTPGATEAARHLELYRRLLAQARQKD